MKKMNDLLTYYWVFWSTVLLSSSYLWVVVHESWLSGESDPEDDVAESSPRQQEDSISSDRAGQQHLERVWDFSGWGRHGFGMTRLNTSISNYCTNNGRTRRAL